MSHLRALVFICIFPSVAFARGASFVTFGEVSDATNWLADAMRGVGLPDVGLGYISDADFVALIALFVFFALLVASVGVILLRERGASLRSGFYVAFLCGLAGAFIYRANQIHPSVGGEFHLYAAFILSAVCGLAAFDFATALKRDRPVRAHATESPLRSRIERVTHDDKTRRLR